MKLLKQEKQQKEITVLKHQLAQSKKRIKSLENRLSTSEKKRKTLLENSEKKKIGTSFCVL